MGVFDLSFWSAVCVALFLTHITIITVTVFLHRSQTHRAVDLHWSLSHFFRFWGWLTTGMVTREWVSIHRKHHAYVDTADDPHSPVVYGVHRILWLGVWKYCQATRDKSILEKFGHGTPNDWIENNVYTPWNWMGIVLMLAADLVLFAHWGLMIWAIQMVWVPFFAAGVINGVGHHWGYRNYHTQDSSRNIFPWGILIGGEELHNNHHAYATSAKLSVKWYEFDVGYMYIRLFEILGLAKVLRKMPKLSVIKKIKSMEERVLTIKKARLMLMARYEEIVFRPFLEHYLSMFSLPEKIKNTEQLKEFLRNKSHDMRNKVADASAEYEILRQLCAHAEKLDELLNAKCQSARQSLMQLQEWCASAKDSRLIQVRQFSEWVDSICLTNVEFVK